MAIYKGKKIGVMANKVRWDADWFQWEIVGDKEWQGEWWRVEEVEKILGFIRFNCIVGKYCLKYGNDYAKVKYFRKFADARAFAKSL